MQSARVHKLLGCPCWPFSSETSTFIYHKEVVCKELYHSVSVLSPFDAVTCCKLQWSGHLWHLLGSAFCLTGSLLMTAHKLHWMSSNGMGSWPNLFSIGIIRLDFSYSCLSNIQFRNMVLMGRAGKVTRSDFHCKPLLTTENIPYLGERNDQCNNISWLLWLQDTSVPTQGL